MQRKRSIAKVLCLRHGVVLLIVSAPLQTMGDDLDANVKPAPPEHGCFYPREANGFEFIDESNFIVYAPSKSNAYQVRIMPPSNELKFAEGIAFGARSGRVCGYAGETVSFGGRTAGRRYSIADVWRLDKDQLEHLMNQFEASGDGQPIEPEPTDGAEVERELSGAEKTD